MRKVFLFFCCCLVFHSFSWAQDQAELYQKEIDRMVPIPNSPEAAAFEKYGNTSVSLYSGTPNIGIPVYTFQGRELNLPISLSYDSSGIKVEQLASNVGLGWNLTVGGRISRSANGYPDDYHSALPSPYSTINDNTTRAEILSYLDERVIFNSENDVLAFTAFKRKVATNEIDAQPDYYSLNALGINDYIVFDLETMVPKTLNNPRIKVVASFDANGQSLESWVVTNDDGTKFYFEEAERTEVQSDDSGASSPFGIIRNYNSSWLLTKIESSNRKDIYEFTYSNLGNWTQDESVLGAASLSVTIDDNTPDVTPIVQNPNFQPRYTIEQHVLTGISHNNIPIVNINLTDRADLTVASAIARIEILKPNSSEHLPNSSEHLMNITFEYDYFGLTPGQSIASKNRRELRLRLDHVKMRSDDDSEYKVFSFEYFDPEDIPVTTSLSQDYLGYYNGANNSVLYPRVTLGNFVFEGADRKPNFLKARIGTLKKIIYPTKGYTEFEYEAHTSPFSMEDQVEEEDQMVTVGYGAVSVSSGTDNSTVCGPCCQDIFPRPPKVNSVVFDITQADNYDLTHHISGQAGNVTEAYLFKKSNLPSNGNCNLTPIPYEGIIDSNSGTCSVIPQGLMRRFEGGPVNTPGDTQSVYLEPGCYQMTVVIGDLTSGAISLSLTRDEIQGGGDGGTIGEGIVERAGLRIKSIKDYAKSNTLAGYRSFQYTNIYNQTYATSGIKNFSPKLHYLTSAISLSGSSNNTNQGDCETIYLNTLNRIGSSSGGSRPHIVYSRVHEIQRALQGEGINGYTSHTFYVGDSGIYSSGVAPNVSSYAMDLKVGKESSIVNYDAGSLAVNAQDSEYAYDAYLQVPGFYIQSRPENAQQVLVIQNLQNGTYQMSYAEAVPIKLGTGGQASDCGFILPPICDDPNYNCVTGDQAATSELRVTLAEGRANYMIRSESKQFFDGHRTVTQINENIYHGASGNFLMKESNTINSKNQDINTQYFYPSDDTAVGAAALISKNNLIEITGQTTKLIDSIAGAGTATELILSSVEKDFIVLPNNVVLPNVMRVQKQNQAPTNYQFTYYSNGNLLSGQLENSPLTTYIWGYDDKFPLATIQNASYSEVVNTGVSFSVLNSYTSSESEKLSELNKIRNGLPNAMVTTYTYDPLVGVTSVTDPRGYTMYYEYDEFNRLQYVRDADNNLISENQYNYKNQN